MLKKIHTIKLELKGGAATPGAQLASLSSKGIKAIEVCKDFNNKTKNQQGKLLRLRVIQYDDKSYKSFIKGTPVPQLLMEAANIKKGSSEPNRTKVATLSKEQIKKIAQIKQEDTNAFKIESVIKIIEGTAKNMGITIT